MNFLRNGIYVALVIFSLLACGGGGSGTSSPTGTKVDKNITIANTALPHVESLGIANTIHAKVSLGNTPKDVYVLLSNYANNSGSVRITKSNKSIDVAEVQSNKIINPKSHIVHAPTNVEAFRNNIYQYLHRNASVVASAKLVDTIQKNEDVSGTQKVFYLGSNTSDSTIATARKIVSTTNTALGNKRLNIWVSDDSFGVGCPKVKCVTQTMVNALADTFLKTGTDNDIYDWVTNVYGEEWGIQSNSRLILPNNEITILLTDIGEDNSQTGGVLGFFFEKDNFKRSEHSGSNERIMLYIDSVLFANGEGSWDIDDFWPKEMVSTLAHEFQHMIHFYQKTISLANGNPTDTWMNEMLSETTEDLVATKIKHTGSRGVDPLVGSAGDPNNTEGRYPLFNTNNRLSLTTWEGEITNYSNVNAFGAYLIRNYGGAKVLHDIVHNALLNEQAVVTAVNKAPNGAGKTFNDLLKEWGIAVLLSDNDNLSTNLPVYNTGDFTLDTYKNSTYEIGSVNFFNYSPTPRVLNASGTVQKQGNYYYKIGSNLTGNFTIDLTLNGQTEATLIAK